MIVRTIFRAAAVLCLLSGCAAEGPLDDASSASRCSDESDETRCASEPAIPQAQVIVAPALRVADIQTSGTGCPLGTAFRTNSTGDSTLELTFTAYGISLAAGQPLSLKECHVQIRLKSDQRYQVQAMNIYAFGEATLQSGQTARSHLQAYMLGTLPPEEIWNRLVGPYNGPLNIGILTNTRVKICSADQMLNINTRLMVTNTGTGTAQAKNQGPLVIKIMPSPC